MVWGGYKQSKVCSGYILRHVGVTGKFVDINENKKDVSREHFIHQGHNPAKRKSFDIPGRIELSLTGLAGSQGIGLQSNLESESEPDKNVFSKFRELHEEWASRNVPSSFPAEKRTLHEEMRARYAAVRGEARKIPRDDILDVCLPPVSVTRCMDQQHGECK